MKHEYEKLTGICAKAIENNLCAGCSKLELKEFKGEEKCSFVKDPINHIKCILGIQEKINL